MIWSLPDISAIKWSLPQLPSFELPCIPVPLLKSCSDPPVVDDEDQSDMTSTSSESLSSSSQPETSTGDPQTSGVTSMSGSSTSKESCSFGTTTVTSCAEGCSVFNVTMASGTFSTTKCYTTTCEPIVGCSVDAITTTSLTTSSTSVEACERTAYGNYDAVATWKAAGIHVPDWMLRPIGPTDLDENFDGINYNDIMEDMGADTNATLTGEDDPIFNTPRPTKTSSSIKSTSSTKSKTTKSTSATTTTRSSIESTSSTELKTTETSSHAKSLTGLVGAVPFTTCQYPEGRPYCEVQTSTIPAV